MSDLFDFYVREAQTGRGARVTYPEFLALLDVALHEQFVVRTVDAYDDARSSLCRGDASFHVPPAQDLTDWAANVRFSVSFARQLLDSVIDRANLRYEVWFDDRGRTKQTNEAS